MLYIKVRYINSLYREHQVRFMLDGEKKISRKLLLRITWVLTPNTEEIRLWKKGSDHTFAAARQPRRADQMHQETGSFIHFFLANHQSSQLLDLKHYYCGSLI